MPIPAAPVGRPGVAATVLRLFEQLHEQIRGEIDGLDDAALNWSLGADANSIATIVTHVIGSEAETLRCVTKVPCARDREAEFALGTRSGAEVLAELDPADALIAALRSEIGPESPQGDGHATHPCRSRATNGPDVAGLQLRPRP